MVPILVATRGYWLIVHVHASNVMHAFMVFKDFKVFLGVLVSFQNFIAECCCLTRPSGLGKGVL